jgi:ectoine hydroxylase-related dioxygenase (phytanoyl-CoA dioxygenase family)
MEDARRSLIESGYCVVREVLPPTMIRDLRAATDALCDGQTEEHAARFRAQGSMFQLGAVDGGVFARLIAWRPALDVLAAMGFAQPTYTDGYVISKPPKSPRLFWHYDWFAWEDPTAYDAQPQQVFFMYYLSDTTAENGCLRAIPGSHRNHNPLHDLLAEPHSQAVSTDTAQGRAELSRRPDEIDVPVSAGDLLIGDARLLHATHPNDSDQRRTVITLWFQPDYANLPERIKAQMVAKTHAIPDAWPDADREAVRRLNPTYEGDAEPYGRSLYRRRSDA